MKTLSAIVASAAPAGPGGSHRADRIVQSLTGLSRAGVRALFDHGCVQVNRMRAEAPQATLQPGDEVVVSYDPGRRYHEKPTARTDPAYDVLFEDEHLIVVNKAAHVLTVPTGRGQGNTLLGALERRHERRARGARRGDSGVHVVHRLDLGVSGVLVFGKSRRMAELIKKQFEARRPRRLYACLVLGEIKDERGTIRSHLGTDAQLNRFSVGQRGKGELAITHYRVLHRAAGATALVVRLETGRRNQIRVHLAEAGHPVLGDPRYPRDQPGSARHSLWKARRLALHAFSLDLEHPITRRPLHFEAAVPLAFNRLLPSQLAIEWPEDLDLAKSEAQQSRPKRRRRAGDNAAGANRADKREGRRARPSRQRGSKPRR